MSCPAYWKLCNSCRKNNHYTKCCNIKNVNYVQKHQGGSKSDEKRKSFEIEASLIVAVSNEDFTPFEYESNEYAANLEVNNTFISFKIDTGAQESILSFQIIFDLQIVLSYNHQDLDYLLIMEPKFQSKLAVCCILHMA